METGLGNLVETHHKNGKEVKSDGGDIDALSGGPVTITLYFLKL
jgi:hypothetical protein